MSQISPGRFHVLPPVVKNLLIINGLLFFATLVFRETFHFDLIRKAGLFFFFSPWFEPYQFLTHMFMHGNLMHLFSNMFALWMFGSVLENVWGSMRFLFFYFSCGFGGALAHLGVSAYDYFRITQAINEYQAEAGLESFATLMARFQDRVNYAAIVQFIDKWKQYPDSVEYLLHSRQIASRLTDLVLIVPVVGASGAVFGILAAFALLFPNVYLYFYFLFPIKAKYFVLFYTIFELYAGFSGQQTGIAHFAHLGGALLGFFLARSWKRKDFIDFY